MRASSESLNGGSCNAWSTVDYDEAEMLLDARLGKQAGEDEAGIVAVADEPLEHHTIFFTRQVVIGRDYANTTDACGVGHDQNVMVFQMTGAKSRGRRILSLCRDAISRRHNRHTGERPLKIQID